MDTLNFLFYIYVYYMISSNHFPGIMFLKNAVWKEIFFNKLKIKFILYWLQLLIVVLKFI